MDNPASLIINPLPQEAKNCPWKRGKSNFTYPQLLIQELATRPGSILNRRRQTASSKRFFRKKLALVICDVDVMQRKSGSVGREPLVTWPEQLTWTVHSDFDDARVETLPVILFEEGCPWRMRAVQALNERQMNWPLFCEATTLVAVATAVQVGLGVGPMITATIPPGCRSINYRPQFPNPVALDIGLYVHNATSESAHCLADFVLRSPGNIFAAH